MSLKAQKERMKKRGRKRYLTEIQQKTLFEFIIKENSLGKLVNIKKIQEKIKLLTKNNRFPQGWKPSKSWVSSTLRKNGFSSHKAIMKNPKQFSTNFQEEIQNFKNEVNKYLKKAKSERLHYNIWVMDETGVWDQATNLRTYTKRKNPQPFIKLIPTRNRRDTFVTCVSFKGEKIPLFGIQHKIRKTSRRKGRPETIIDNGCRGMNITQMYKWITVFKKVAKKGDLLILDNLNVHHNKGIIKELEKNFKLIFLPAYSASYLSPLDNSLFSLLKSHTKEKIFPTYLCKWMLMRRAFNKITSHQIKEYFKHCGLPFYCTIRPLNKKKKTKNQKTQYSKQKRL